MKTYHLKSINWPWALYGLILSWFLIRKSALLFISNTPENYYYFFLTSFDPIFYGMYICNVTQTFLNIFHFIPLVLFIRKINYLSKEFWQAMFISKVIFDILGHSYELNYLLSLWKYNQSLSLFIGFTSMGTYIPFYAACFSYAFIEK